MDGLGYHLFASSQRLWRDDVVQMHALVDGDGR